MNKKCQQFYVWKTDKDWNPIEDNEEILLTAPSLDWAVSAGSVSSDDKDGYRVQKIFNYKLIER